jgi:hypothetical protein
MSARELISSGGLGQTLAVYAAIRAREPLTDPLATLGLPLIDELLTVVGETPNSVAAMTGSSGDFEHWSLLLAFPSGLRATADIGAGIGPGQPDALELRVEWSGTEQALLIEPGAVGVTVTTGTGTTRHSSEVNPIGAAILTLTGFESPSAARVIAAARQSVTSNTPAVP